MWPCHSWSGPFGHFHQTIWCDPEANCSGVRGLFFVGCHSPATWGKNRAREFVTETFLPEQHGQPLFVDGLVRLFTVACHSWSDPFGHFHQTFCCDPATTLS